MAEVGSKQLEVRGLDDKRKITALLTAALWTLLNSFNQETLVDVTLIRAMIAIIAPITGVHN